MSKLGKMSAALTPLKAGREWEKGRLIGQEKEDRHAR